MKQSIALLVMIVSLNSMACEVTLLAKKPDSKSFVTVDGQTVSLKKAKELAAYGCKVRARLMSADEAHTLDLIKATKRLEKLQAGPQKAGAFFEVK